MLLFCLMKRLILIYFIAGFTFTSFAQTQTQLPEGVPLYKKEPGPPPLRIVLQDSVKIFTEKDLKKNTPLFLIIFSPECEHCQKETEELIDSIDRFKNIQILMVTTFPFSQMKAYIETYQLNRFKNITVGWDKFLILPTYYRMRNFPFLAYYDKKGKLIDVTEGALPLHKVLEKFQQ